ncbi:hydrocephalus-inducing protein homolog isoform X2 [Triplophysa dalaica]|nr:hydrocephalus-inducing protein homolog isoform X2 [Triplophysa dalaica]
MSQSTEERLANTYEMHPPRILELLDMTETTHHKFSSLDLDQAVFQPYPSEIVFQNFTPFQTHKVPLELRNSDKVPRLVKVIEDDSLYFKVVSPLEASKKVAPGMASTFTILFTPQENKDYIHRLICVTEREKFEVPIRAIGPRAILDFPDNLHFPVCPVKCLSQKTLFVRNIGKCEAKFRLSTSSPFSVEPLVGTLDVGQGMQVTVQFLPKTTGDHSQDLLLHYHSGEDIKISLYGVSKDIDVRLDKNSVMVEKTYISLANYEKVTIMNRSHSIVHYQWKTFATQEEEEQDKLRLSSELNPEGDERMQKSLTESTDPSVQARLSLFSQSLQEQLLQTQQQLLALDRQHIITRPLEGEIWPNSTAEVTIIFRPQEAKIYQETIFCEITGRERRLPLFVQGESMGPKLKFNFNFLDMGNIFIGSKQSYKLVLSNKGLIKGTYRLIPPRTMLGLCFSFSPSDGMIPPGACQTMEVYFSAGILGVFSEELQFSVEGNPEPVTITMRGCLIGPTFHFNVPELNFGVVSVGFPQTLTCCLSNTSMVPMSFGLRIPGDGTGQSSITSADQIAQLNRNDWGLGEKTGEKTKEFLLSLTTGTVCALGEIDIQLTICSNTVQDYNLALVLDVQGVGEEVFALAIKARCIVPDVTIENPDLQFQHVFLGRAYEKSVKLINDTNLPACYGLLPQLQQEDPCLLYSSDHRRGVIQPRSTVQMPLVIVAKGVGSMQQTAYIAILGHQDPPLKLLLSCVGQGPSVSVTSAKLNFGCIPVLIDVPMTLQLSNNSPIPARFLAQMVKNKSHWHVEPSEGEIPPEESLDLKVIAHLNDTVAFQDELMLEIQDSQTYAIPLSAKGKGTTIVTDRPFAPCLDLGIHFSSGPCQYHFRITNRGRRTHKLSWITEGFAQLHSRSPVSPIKPKATKIKSLQSSVQEAPVFRLSPAHFTLAPGQTTDMLLEGSSDIPKVVREKLVCHAVVGRQYEKEVIMTADVTCQFVSPTVDISSQQVSFYVVKAPDVSLVPLYQRLVLKNMSSLNLSLKLTLREPFALCAYEGDELFKTSKGLGLGIGAQEEVWVCFNPLFQQDRFSRMVEDVLELCYDNHPQRDRVALRGEVHFPNLEFSSTTLDFGCILNYTKSRRKLTMTNCSPLCVSYRWTFLVDRHHCHIGFFDVESRGIEEFSLGNGEESEEARWELLETKEADGKTDPNRETDIIKPCVDKESSGQEENRTYSRQRSASTELGTIPINLTAKGHPSVGVKEVFNISSLYGELQPGDTKLVTFSFLGHADISAHALALCEVEGGPTYEITLMGEASSVSYILDTNEIDFGLQLFDHVAEAEITLKNTGKVGFDFYTLPGAQGLSVDQPLPGQPLIVPSKGHLRSHAEIRFSVYYLPGTPEFFQETFHLQLAFNETENITIRGEGIFPRVYLDLPRDLNEEIYGFLLKEAKNQVASEKPREGVLSRSATDKEDMPTEDDYIPTYDNLLQMELERLLVKENAIAVQKQLQGSDLRGTAGSTNSMLKKLSKLSLPEYILDFGYVIKGSVATHIVKITNTCPLPVSLRAVRSLTGTGFSTELDKVQNLPFCETETFEVKFDACGDHLDLGKITAILPIQVVKGPQVQVRLRADVTVPSLTVSTDALLFDTIQCGFCQVATVQLYNHGPVPCEWSIRQEERPKKIDKHTPLYLRRQARQKQRPPPVIFEMLPSDGSLYPGERSNVQVKFSPAEGRAYSQRLVITIAQSTQKILLLAQGQGDEPLLEFSSSVLQLGPVLPYSEGTMADVMVRNPCSFPVEFYSVDFDKQYLEEEEILRVVKGYDAQNVLLLPPRAPGETLPQELLDFYKKSYSQETKQESGEGFPEKDTDDAAALFEAETLNSKDLGKDDSTSRPAVGDLEYDLVSRAIARHMGIDLSPEGKAAQNRRGIAIIVHGAPSSGKTRTAVTLAMHYGAACLSIDEVVQETMSSGISSAGLRARELCAQDAIEEDEVDTVATPAQGPGVLSVEAVAKHTADGSQIDDRKVPPSSASTRNKTNVTGHSQKNSISAAAAPSVADQTHRRVSVTASPDTGGLTNGLLPEDLLVEILSDRLQLSDCHRGVVIDGLETQYCHSLSNTLQIVLQALNNRRHIYFINLFSSYSVFKRREKDRFDQEQEIRRQQELEDLREEDETPNEDSETKPKHLALVEDQAQELQSSECDTELPARFKLYEQSQPDVQHILLFWDRTQGFLLQPRVSEVLETEETTEVPVHTAKKNKKEREKEKVDKEKMKADTGDLKSPVPSQVHVTVDDTEGLDRMIVSEPIPHIWLSIQHNNHLSGFEIINSIKLPSLEEILDELEIGPNGPPIPQPMIFSIVQYPKKRSVPSVQPSSYYTFTVPASPEDMSEEKKDEDLASDNRGPVLSVKEGMTVSDTSQSIPYEEAQSNCNNRLTPFRWVVPPNGAVTFRITFHPTVVGKFDQTFSFDLMGTKRCYQLLCSGICANPSINRDHKVLFAHCKKTLRPESGLQKTYIIQSDVYDYGPLLCGKTRERYKEKFPENMEKFVIHNNSLMEAEIHFYLQHDTKATTFFLAPSNMTLQPNEKKALTVWAYPNTPKQIEDNVVCCIKGNPELAVFSVCCTGVRPELELDHKLLQFDKIPLYRKETQTLWLHNKTLLPAAWKLLGLDMLGDEFSVSQNEGIVMPHSKFCLHMNFMARVPIKMKRAVCLEVLDIDGIYGIVQHSESIQVIAEAYDIAVDIHLTEGSEGSLDFGIIKVSEEVKRTIKLENKGKYDIAFKFALKPTEPGMPDLNSIFSITPQNGCLRPNNRPTSIQITFQHNTEISIKENPILCCQVIEPNLDGGETINTNPIKVSVQSLYSKYSINPSNNINFGALVFGSRKKQIFTVENKGHFEISVNIRMCKNLTVPAQRRSLSTKKASKDSYANKPPSASELRHTLHSETGMHTQTQTLSVFSLSPCTGILAPGAQLQVNVDCKAEHVGKWVECLAVDISDRDPSDNPNGIPYKLVAEVCMPGIASADVASIFEEHRICKNSSMLQCEQYRDSMGVYVQDENKFIFNNVLVGRSAKAQFRITNPGKVPCELSLMIRSVKPSPQTAEVFELTPTKMYIASHSHAFATVTFSPLAMQMCHAVFEATLKGATSQAPGNRNKALVFDVMGEGNLPCVTVLRPVQRTNRGHPVLQFKRLLVGRSQSLPIVIRNNGTLPAQVSIVHQYHLDVFTLKAAAGTVCRLASSCTEGDAGKETQFAHVASLTLVAGQQAEFQVGFHPKVAQIFEANMKVMVQDNQYDQTLVQLVGESYHDIIILDNLGSKVQQDITESSSDLHFGDCHVGHAYQETFTMTNPSQSRVLRFEWFPSCPQLSLSPQVGHLHSGCSKAVTVTFCSEQPVILNAQTITCKLSSITFQQPIDQVSDWDNCHRTVKWVDVDNKSSQRPAKQKVVVTDPEPLHSVMEDSSKDVELKVSATCDYIKYQCDTAPIRFKDTMLYQTRVYKLQMENKGSVHLEYSWQVLMETYGKTACFEQGGRTSRSAHGRRTPLRPASSLQNVCSLLLGDPELPRFSVEPGVGSISPGESQTFHIRFSPLEVAEFEARLICSIPNLKDGESPVITVSGRSLLPYCHFHLKDSDYLTANRRDPELHSLLNVDPNTSVIEFTSVGIGTSVHREFGIVNPTNKTYSFMWRCEDSGDSLFKCCTPNKSIQPGKEVKVLFQYQALDLELVESYWTFLIPEHNLSLPFLLVGAANEPVVYIDRAHVNLGSLLVGFEAHQTVFVVNSEDQPFHFNVQETSCHSEGFQESLVLEPMEGTVPAEKKIPLIIRFTPTREGDVTFNLVMTVQKKLQPLTMNVKGECYSMNARVKYESPEESTVELSESQIHPVDFKQVELNDKSTCTFVVTNPGKFRLDVEYDLSGPAALQPHLQVEPKFDTVPVGGQSYCTLIFCPQRKCVLRELTFSIKIKNGPTFCCSLMGSALAPELEFSFLKYNFGMHFIHCIGMTPATHTMVISNRNDRGIRLDCLFSVTPVLEVSFTPQVIPPGGSVEVLFSFYPRKAVRYHEKVVFEMNKCARQIVEILGQGIEMKINLEDPAHKIVNFGALQTWQRSRKLVPLVNNSHCSLTFTLVRTHCDDVLRDSKVLSVRPEGQVTLKAGGGRCVAELLFSPERRMPHFTEELQLECLGAVRPLLVMKGCCQGVEVGLDTDFLQFGAVVQRCQATRHIIMQNNGDIGARFKWDVKSFAPDFLIFPSEGYITPGMEVSLEVTFAPMVISQDLRYDDLCCTIEGGKTLKLTLTGSCIAPVVATEVVNFVCPVRSQCTQSVTVPSRINQRWTLKCVIEGKHWSGPPTLLVDPPQQNTYEITYKPLVMTADGQRHEGSVFFCFPDGTGILYILHGTAEPPKAESTITEEIECKSHHTQIVSVHNWLPRPQRFRAIMEQIKPDRSDGIFSLKGMEYIEVPPLEKRNYTVSFFTYKEGQFNAKVTFKNEATGEYLFYNLNYKATPPGVISTIEMVTRVRQMASGSVEVENPLLMDLYFSSECQNADINVPPQFFVPSQSKGTLTFEYQPLCLGETKARLVLYAAELGHYFYELQLKALPAPPEKPLYFKAPLGSRHSITAKFTNYSRVKTEYICKADSPNFIVEKSIKTAPGNQAGTDVSVTVHFEPFHLGEIHSLLTISSELGGKYVFPLYGTCTPPKAQGPLNINSGSSVSIPFKNVFQQATTFSFHVDNPVFTIKGTETIPSQKTHSIQVIFEGPPVGSRGPCHGKLTISCPRMEAHGQGIFWVYYLKGNSPDLASEKKTS